MLPLTDGYPDAGSGRGSDPAASYFRHAEVKHTETAAMVCSEKWAIRPKTPLRTQRPKEVLVEVSADAEQRHQH